MVLNFKYKLYDKKSNINVKRKCILENGGRWGPKSEEVEVKYYNKTRRYIDNLFGKFESVHKPKPSLYKKKEHLSL
jgi:hypothetical protein